MKKENKQKLTIMSKEKKKEKIKCPICLNITCRCNGLMTTKPTKIEDDRDWFHRLEDLIYEETNAGLESIEGDLIDWHQFCLKHTGFVKKLISQAKKKEQRRIVGMIEIQMNDIVAGKKLLQSEKLLTDLDNANANGQFQALYYLIKTLK